MYVREWKCMKKDEHVIDFSSSRSMSDDWLKNKSAEAEWRIYTSVM